MGGFTTVPERRTRPPHMQSARGSSPRCGVPVTNPSRRRHRLRTPAQLDRRITERPSPPPTARTSPACPDRARHGACCSRIVDHPKRRARLASDRAEPVPDQVEHRLVARRRTPYGRPRLILGRAGERGRRYHPAQPIGLRPHGHHEHPRGCPSSSVHDNDPQRTPSPRRDRGRGRRPSTPGTRDHNPRTPSGADQRQIHWLSPTKPLTREVSTGSTNEDQRFPRQPVTHR